MVWSPNRRAKIAVWSEDRVNQDHLVHHRRDLGDRALQRLFCVVRRHDHHQFSIVDQDSPLADPLAAPARGAFYSIRPRTSRHGRRLGIAGGSIGTMSASSPFKRRPSSSWREGFTSAAVAPYGRLLAAIGLSAAGLVWMVKLFPALHALVSAFPWDFAVDHQTARGFVQDVNPFSQKGAFLLGLPQRFGASGSGHPPTTSFWALPFVSLTVEQANVALGWLTVLLLLIELTETFRTLRWPAAAGLAWLTLAYLLSSSSMHYHLRAGQFSGAIGFLYFVAWRAGRRGDDLLAGIALGLACTMKLFPGVMLLLMLATRRWRALAAASAAYLVVAVVMTSRYGLSSWLFFLRVQPAIANTWMSSIKNQSIHGVILKLFYPVCGPSGPTLPVATALSALICLALLAVATWWVSRRPSSGEALDLPFALFIVLSVITSQWTWEHYAVIYVLPEAILIDKLMRTPLAGRKRLTTIATLVLAAAVIATWQIDLNEKLSLQSAVRAGQSQLHLRLHVFDVLNWAPGFVLALLLFVMVRRMPLMQRLPSPQWQSRSSC